MRRRLMPRLDPKDSRPALKDHRCCVTQFSALPACKRRSGDLPLLRSKRGLFSSGASSSKRSCAKSSSGYPNRFTLLQDCLPKNSICCEVETDTGAFAQKILELSTQANCI